MIKINLLPKTINQKAILRNTALAFAAVLVAVIAGGVTYNMQLKAKVTEMENQASAVEALKARAEGIQAQAKNTLASVDPIQKKLDFINGVLQYNLKFPELYSEVAKWTYKNVQYTSMASDGTAITMGARVKNLDDLGRFLLNMYRATNLFTEVTITGVQGTGFSQATYGGGNAGMGQPAGGPTYQPPMASGTGSMAGLGAISAGVQKAPGQANWIDFTVQCKLKTPIVAPAFQGGAAGAQPGGAGAPVTTAAAPTGATP